MTPAIITIKPSTRRSKKVLIEIDAEQFERLASNLGLFSEEFLASIDRAEQEVNKGKVRTLRNFRDLRRI